MLPDFTFSACASGAASKGKALISVSDKQGLEKLAKVTYRGRHIIWSIPVLLLATLRLKLSQVLCVLYCHCCLQGLSDQGYELVSTGGSAAALEKASLPVQRVEQLTGFPEMLDGTSFISYSTLFPMPLCCPHHVAITSTVATTIHHAICVSAIVLSGAFCCS